MAVKFTDPSFQKVCETVIERHGGNVATLTAAGMLISPMEPETLAAFRRNLEAEEKRIAGLRDMLALCDMASRFGYTMVEGA